MGVDSKLYFDTRSIDPFTLLNKIKEDIDSNAFIENGSLGVVYYIFEYNNHRRSMQWYPYSKDEFTYFNDSPAIGLSIGLDDRGDSIDILTIIATNYTGGVLIPRDSDEESYLIYASKLNKIDPKNQILIEMRKDFGEDIPLRHLMRMVNYIIMYSEKYKGLLDAIK